MKMSDSIANIATALAEFQSIVNNVSKTSTNPAFKSKYASLDEIIKEIRQPMKKCGLSFVQNPYREGNAVGVSTLLIHTSGEYMFFDAVVITLADKGNSGHQVGSAMTYARRYSLASALGIASEEDTDGNDIDPTKKQHTSYKDSSYPKYETKKPSNTTRPLPNSWSKLAEENIRSAQETGLDRKRFFAICKRKNLTDKQQKAIVFLHTGELSRKNVTPEQFREINHNIHDATQDELYHMVVKALQQFRNGAVV